MAQAIKRDSDDLVLGRKRTKLFLGGTRETFKNSSAGFGRNPKVQVKGEYGVKGVWSIVANLLAP